MDESQFIAKCAEKKITSPTDIALAATERVKEIDAEIQRVDLLRRERQSLVNIIKMFGGEPPRSVRKTAPTLSDEMSQDQIDPRMLHLLIKVCDLISTKGALTPRAIFDEMGITPDHNAEVYVALKWLLSRGVLVRNDDRSLRQGPKWETRPSLDF